ncbi:MAG TPA: diacylglyceryl transferase, partial [Flavobacteriales bacterium]|nr:diacylglyceryl transferase [Flavobacteriales bacterium]
KRKEKEGLIESSKVKTLIGKGLSVSDILSAIFFGFLIGFKGIEALFHYSDLVANPQGFILSSRGHFFGGVIIAIISLYLKWKENKKTKLETPQWIEKEIHPHELVANMTMIAAISGIIGAKLFHNLENIGEFMADPMGQLMAFSGLTFYGGLIAGAFSVIWYGNKYKIKTLHLIDAAAPGLMIAYGIGRIGCQLSGDGDWGIINLATKPDWMAFLPDWMWSFTYPHNVINAGIPIDDCTGRYCMELAQGVYPTPFYEIIMATLIFAFLWTIRKRIKVAGALFFVYLTLNGVERFFIEKIRVNTEYNILGGITQAEIISSSLVLIGVAGCFYLFRNSKQ